jgi:putative DNA primase/helicase
VLGNEFDNIDLCDPSWRVIEIGGEGWSVLKNSPVIFTRKPGMLPLPEPKRDGSICSLWPLLNIAEVDRPLFAGFLTSALRGEGPYFCLNLYGTEGSAKTTATRIVRRIFDPNDADVASFPKDERDLAISAASQMCVTFENVSSLSGRQSDWMCRLATGGAFRTRTLYTNDEESILKFCRPAIINGIPNVVSRGDLASRSISIELEMIDESRRQEESDIETKFHEVWPDIFGAFCSSLSQGLRSIGAVHDEFQGLLPRMADAALFATAAEEALGFEKGAFIARLNEAQGMAREDLLESDPIANWIIEFLSSSDKWSGAPFELLEELREDLPDDVLKDKSFPKDATRLGNHIRRIESLLQTQGISVERSRTGKRRIICFAESENLVPSASHRVTTTTTTVSSGDAVTLSDAENQNSNSAQMIETVI